MLGILDLGREIVFFERGSLATAGAWAPHRRSTPPRVSVASTGSTDSLYVPAARRSRSVLGIVHGVVAVLARPQMATAFAILRRRP